MRVVFLTHNYPRRPATLPARPLGALARALVRRGLSVRIIAPADEGGEAVVDGVPVLRVRVPRSIREMVSSNERVAATLRTPLGWLSLRRLRRALRTAARQEIAAGADLFHAHWWLPAGLAAPPGVPLVLTVHGTDAALLKQSRIARSLARPIFQRATVVTAVSREVGNWVQAGAGRFVDTATFIPCRSTPVGTPGPGGAGAPSSSPASCRRSGWSSPSRQSPYSPPAVTTCRSRSWETGRSVRSLEQRVVRLGISAPGTVRRRAVGTRSPRVSRAGRRHAVHRAG